jgi:hypothetical protein
VKANLLDWLLERIGLVIFVVIFVVQILRGLFQARRAAPPPSTSKPDALEEERRVQEPWVRCPSCGTVPALLIAMMQMTYMTTAWVLLPSVKGALRRASPALDPARQPNHRTGTPRTISWQTG